jgi:hypothetical protein
LDLDSVLYVSELDYMEVCKMKKKWTFALLALLLFLSLPVPVWADDGDDQLVFFGDSVVLGPGDDVDGNLVVIGGSVEMREGSRVRGDLVAVGGESVVDGRIEGSLVVVGGTLDLRDNATVLGELVTFSANVSQAEGARVFGERIQGFRWKVPPLTLRDWSWRPWSFAERWRSPDLLFSDLFGSAARWVLRTFALMALAVVVMLLLPRQTELVGQTVSQLPLPSTGVGLLTFVVLLFLVPLLVIICIGIPVVLVLAVAFVAAVLLGRVAVGVVVGQRLLSAVNVKPSQPLLQAVVGIGLVELLTAVPCLGWLLGWILALAGLGAVVLTRFGTMPYQPQSGQGELPERSQYSAEDQA